MELELGKSKMSSKLYWGRLGMKPDLGNCRCGARHGLDRTDLFQAPNFFACSLARALMVLLMLLLEPVLRWPSWSSDAICTAYHGIQNAVAARTELNDKYNGRIQQHRRREALLV